MEAEGSLFSVIENWGTQEGFYVQEFHRVLAQYQVEPLNGAGIRLAPPLLAAYKEIPSCRVPSH